MDDQQQPSPASLQLICAAVLAMPLVYMGAAIAMRIFGVIPETGVADLRGTEAALMMQGAFLVVGIVTVMTSPMIKKAILRSASAPVTPQLRFRAVLVAMALTESAAVLGFVLILLTGNVLIGAVLCGFSFASTCFHFPRRLWLEQGDDPQ